jgi:hypothetical protein
VIDLGGNLLAPGLIDAQINGAYGVDFSELDVSAPDGGEARYVQKLEVVAGRIVETGCTSFVPTIMSLKEELYAKVGRTSRSFPLSRSCSGCLRRGRRPEAPTRWVTMRKVLSCIPGEEAPTRRRCSGTRRAVRLSRCSRACTAKMV